MTCACTHLAPLPLLAPLLGRFGVPWMLASAPDPIDALEQKEIEEFGAVPELPATPEPPGMMRVDLHCHTEASNDCRTPLGLIIEECQRRQIRVQAITDHDQIWGAQELQAEVQRQGTGAVAIIIGEEISSAEGEIIGLFLTQRIEPGLSAEETVVRIREQQGLVLLPHGFDPLKRYRLRPSARKRIATDIDIIESFNARISRPRWNRMAVRWAQDHHKVLSAGSDAHRLQDIGAAWVEVPLMRTDSPAALMAALAQGVPTGKWTHPAWAYMLKMSQHARGRLGW